MRPIFQSTITLAIIFLAINSFAQTAGDYRSNVAPSGNWNTSASWQTYNGSTWVAATDYPGQNTGAGTVTVRDGDDITLNVSPANAIGAFVVGEGASGTFQTSNNNRTLNVTNGLTVKAGGSFNLRRITIAVGGNTQIDGTVTDNNDNGSATFTGTVAIGSTGSFSTTNASDFTFGGAVTNDGTFSLTGGGVITFKNGITNNNSFDLADVTFSNNNQSIAGSSTITISGVTTVTGITVTNSNTDLNITGTAAGTLTGTGTWKQGTNGVLKYSGSTITVTAADFNTNVNTVDYTRGGAQTVLLATYQNLTISTSNTKTLGGAITVNGNLDISGSATLATDVYQITGNATGTFTMASGTTLTLGKTTNATNILFPTNFTNGNTTLNSASTVTYQNNSTQTVSSTPTYGNLTIATGSTKTINGNTTVGGNLTISAGTLDLGTTATTLSVSGTATVTGTLTFSGTTTKTVTITGDLSGAGTINMSGGSLLHNLNLGGANNAITTFTTAAVASTVTYNRSGNQQVFGSVNYRNLSTSGSGTKSMQAAVTVNNTFTIGSNTSFDPVGNSITVSGSSVFAGTLAESNTGGTNSFQAVDLSGGTINGSVTDVTNINGNLTMPTGNGTIGRTTLTVSGTTTVATGRSLTINSNTGVKTFVGAVTISGSGSWTSTSVTTAGNLIFRGGIDVTSASGSLSADVATFNTNSQNITGAGALSFSGAVAITGAITITNTNTNGVTFNSTVNGSAAGSTWKNGASGVTYYQPGATTQPMNTGVLDVSASGNYFYYSRAAAQTIKVPASSYYHLYVTGGSSALKSLNGTTSVSGNFQLAGSTNFDPGANDFTVSGTSTIAGTFIDGNAGGTTSLQDVDLSGGTIDNAAVTGVVNINGNLTVPTATGTIGRVTLTTTGTTTVATGRTLTFNANSNTGVKIFTGAITVSGTGTWTSTNISTASNLDIRGGIDVTSSSGSFAAGAATFSTNSQNITGAGPLTFADAVSISGAIIITNTNTNSNGVTFNGTIDGTVAGSTWKNDVNSTVYYQPAAATQPMNTGTLDVSASGNNFHYSRTTGAQTVKTPSSAYHNLIISGAGGIIKTLAGNTTVNGNLTIAASTTLDVDNAQNYSLTLKGNFLNSGTFQARSGTVTLNGSSNQAVTSNSSSLYNLTIANTATQVSLNDNLTVSNLLTLTDGVITTGASYRVIVSNSSSASVGGYSSSSFVNGNLRRYIATNTDTYTFPVGNGTGTSTYYQADMINNNLTGITYIDSKFKPLTGHNDNELIAFDLWEHGALDYTTINTAGVWELEPNAAPSGGSYNIKLYITNMDGFTDNNFGPLKRLVGSTSGADWSTGGGTLNNDDSPGRTIADGYMQRNGLTTFSEFGGGGGTSGGAGLPIELISFTTIAKEDHVEIKWTTATEINNDFFIVERSKDAITFETLNIFVGAGNSSESLDYLTYDRNPFSGTSYYRLTQVDYDGKFTYSDIVSVHMAPLEISFVVSPNPVTGNNFSIQMENTGNETTSGNSTISLFDLSGKEIFSNPLDISHKRQSFELPVNIAKGIYLLVINHSGNIINQKLTIN